MAIGTGGRELGRGVVWIGRLVVIGQMAANACVGGAVVITIVAYGAVVRNGYMGSGQYIIVVVDREGGRGPVWVGGMTGFAGCRDVDNCVVGVGRCIKIRQVTADTGIGCVDITALVACKAVACYRSMGTGKRINIVVVERRWRPCGC